MAGYETKTRRFTRAEYERLIELGIFQPGEEIELIEPVPAAAAPFGWRYARREVVDSSARVTPLAVPGASVAVSLLLP